MLPLTDSMAQMTVQIEGRPIENPAAAPRADTYAVRPEYFETTGVPLLRGRGFEHSDGERAAPVVIIGKTMAEELWPGEDPIGRVIESLLFGISARDLTTYAAVIVMTLAGALAACLFPACRAASVDAAVTLRAE